MTGRWSPQAVAEKPRKQAIATAAGMLTADVLAELRRLAETHNVTLDNMPEHIMDDDLHGDEIQPGGDR